MPVKSSSKTGTSSKQRVTSRRRRRPLLLYALLGSLLLHLAFGLPALVPHTLFAAKAPEPDAIPVEIVTLPAKNEEPEPPAPPPPAQEKPPEPPPKPVQLPPPTPPPPVTPQQIIVATREVATPPQGDEKPNAAAEKPEPQQKPQPMPPPKPQAKPEPPKPEPPPEREVTGAIALTKPPVKPRDQITDADHKLPPMVVRPLPPGRMGSSLMPSYPSAARANGLQGRVVLLVTLSLDGRPRRIDIARSSGFDQLDESAVRAVWLWRFYFTDRAPPTEPTIEIPLDFKL
jgi:protein TonB